MPSLTQTIHQNAILGSVPLDILILGLFAALVAADGIRSGTRRAAVFCITAPLTTLLYNLLPNARFIGPTVSGMHSASSLVGIFVAIFIVLFVLIYRIVPESGGSGAIALQGLAGAAAAVIVLSICWLQVPALIALWAPSQMIQALFDPGFRFFWLGGAYAALAFTRR